AWENAKAQEFISKTAPIVAPIYREIVEEKVKEEELLPEQRAAFSKLRMGQALYDGIGSNIKAWVNETLKMWPEAVQKEKQKEIKAIRTNLFEIEEKNLIE
ncbi:MAG: hypothetical protein N3G19_00780, partial [Candidatus Pacearchaeota archaeon]|nr:hypothetical protein [Candidatus Pacearchaeota archaeon]